jgi:hypothetical protein
MNLLWIILPAFVLAIGVAGLVVVLAAYSWGRYAWIQALRTAGSRGKAYVTALLPAVVFAISFERNPMLAEHAMYTLFLLGAPAAIGVATRSREG